MLRVGVGLSAERDSERAAEEAASAALRSGGLSRADLLLVFATTAHGPGFTAVGRTAGAVGATRDVVGCSAAGVLAAEEEIEDGPGVAVLALGGGLTARRFFVGGLRGRAPVVADEIAEAIGAARGPSGDERLLVLFADSYNLDAAPLLRGLAEHFPGLRVVGGGASEDGTVGEVSVFTGDAVSSNAVAGVLIEGDFRVRVEVSQAIRRVGPVRRVTAGAGNTIVALDGRPAYAEFARLVPAPLLADQGRALAVVLAAIGDDDGDFTVRHLVGLDRDRGTVSIAEPVTVGQEIFFGIRDPGAAREHLQDALEQEAGAWRTGAPAGGLYVTCVGRGRRFYGVPGLDSAYIRRHLGPVPVAGFFSGAEIGSRSGIARLHQYSGILTLFGPGS